MIDSSTIKSLNDTDHLLRELILSESQNLAIMKTQDPSALTVQVRTVEGRGHESDFGARGCGDSHS